MSHLSNDYVAYAAAIILYHVTDSSDVIGNFLHCLRCVAYEILRDRKIF